MALSIKRITAPAHRKAEAAVALATPFASRRAYADYLARLYGFYAEVEPILFERLSGVLPDANERAKLPLLTQDLRVLDASAVVTAAPRCRSLPRLTCAASAMGVAYVLEGKTLGSRFLLEDARRLLGLDAGCGASFFAGYGPRTGAMWRAYRDALEVFVGRRGCRATVLLGAQSTFASFTTWVTPASSSTAPVPAAYPPAALATTA